MARTPKAATKPIALPELPSRQFYTLVEAAAELNRIYGRTDIDENYILQLANIGKISVQWRFASDQKGYFLIPQWYDWSHWSEDFSEFDFYQIQSSCVKILDRIPFLNLASHQIGRFIFQDTLNIDDVAITNIFSAADNTFVQDPLLKNGFHFELVHVKPESGLNIVDSGVVNLDTGSFCSIKSSEFSTANTQDNRKAIRCFSEKVFEADFIIRHKANIDIKKTDLYVLGEVLNQFKQGIFIQRTLTEPQENRSASLQANSPKEFRASTAASAIALLCLHKDIKLDNHSTVATQLLGRLPESLTGLIGSTSMIDLLKEAKDLMNRIEQVQAAETQISKN